MPRAPAEGAPLTLDGAALALGCSRRWLSAWLARHPHHGYRVGRTWRFTSADIEEIREALRCRSRSSDDTDRRSGISAAPCAASALTKALALTTGARPKKSEPAAKPRSLMNQSTVVALSLRSRTPL